MPRKDFIFQILFVIFVVPITEFSTQIPIEWKFFIYGIAVTTLIWAIDPKKKLEIWIKGMIKESSKKK